MYKHLSESRKQALKTTFFTITLTVLLCECAYIQNLIYYQLISLERNRGVCPIEHIYPRGGRRRGITKKVKEKDVLLYTSSYARGYRHPVENNCSE